MYQNDYIIAFDEKGKPYIAHSAVGNAVNRVASAVKNARGDRQNHKYILKIDENGRKRYFYTQDEVKAYYEEKRKQAAGVVDKAKEGIKNATTNAKEAASSAYNKAKDSANNTVTNAKNQFERMKSEFRDKADKAGDTAKATTQSAADRLKDVSGINARKNVQTTQKALDDAKTAENRAENRWWTNAKEAMAHPSDKTEARERQSMEDMSNKTHERYLAEDAARDARIAYRKTPLAKAEDALNNVKNTVKDIAGYDEREHRNNAQKRVDEARESGNTPTTMDNTRAAQAQKAYNKTPLGMIENARNAISSAKDAAEKAGTAVKDKAEDLSAKAKSTAQAAKESAQGMIENARSSTAKAVNEAWDKIPKNADGTVNPFDSNFQSAYNDWKSKKDKYDGSLTGQAKAVAEKATDSVKDMINRARKAISNEPPKPTLSNPNNPIQKENIIEEQRIEEQRIPEQRIEEQRITEKRNDSYIKKPDPVNSSGARPYETMKRDAREAGIDFTAYDKAASNAEKLAKRLMKEYREANESSGPKSLTGKMWYDDPEYKRAVEKRKTEEEKLVKQLYQ